MAHAFRSTPLFVILVSCLATAGGCIGALGGSQEEDEMGTSRDALEPAPNQAGIGETVHVTGAIDRSNPFFQSLGINGRSCGSCHDARTGWTMTPGLARAIFEATDGTDPLFRPHDQANRPDADVSTLEARRAAYSVLLTKALTRFTRVPLATWDFEVIAVDDPYGWSTTSAISNFRRPLPVANVAHEPSITWTGGPKDVFANLVTIMNGGTKGHAQRPTDLPIEVQIAGANFMMGLTFAQLVDDKAGRLDAEGAFGGPAALAKEPFYLGINGLLGDSKTGAAFDPESFGLFEAWEDFDSKHKGKDTQQAKARARIARGEEAFYTIEFDITGVAGLNDALGMPTIRGRCTTCHNTPNVGSHSEFRMIDEGIADEARRTPDIPLLTIRNKSTGEIKRTTDLARATATGKWADVGKVKVPTLRGLAARAPYFHNGSAANLHEVLDFYESRFHIEFKSAKPDIVAFLQAL